MNARRNASLFVIVAALVQAALALAQQGLAPAGPASSPKSPSVATVGARSIPKAELDRRTALAVKEFSERGGSGALPPEMRDLLRRQVLESLIRNELLSLEAKRTGVIVTPAEAEAVLKRDPFFNPGGQFDQKRYVTARTVQKSAFDGALLSIQSQIAGRKLNDQLVERYMPSEASAHSTALRSLSRVTAEHLTLRRAEFDGGYLEPREEDVLAYYRSHQEGFSRPDRATLTVTFVNSPGLSDSASRLPRAVESWTRRMKVTADSLLAQIAGGAELGVAAGYLSPRPGIVVAAGNFPGYWRGTGAQERLVFDPRMIGKVVPEPVAGEEGWMLIRVDDATPAHVAPLREVAREVRGILRRDRKQHAEEYAQRAIYDQLRDSLAAPGLRVRYIVFDTAAVKVAEPSAADLDRYYRGHLADYSAFDPRSGSIVAKPFGDVRGHVRGEFIRDAKLRQVRLGADVVQRSWAAGKRDPVAEAAGSLREATAPVGAYFDASLEGQVVADTIWARRSPNAGLFSHRGGWVVWQVLAHVERTVPSFAQARPALSEARRRYREAEDLAGGRSLFDANPQQFSRGNVISYSRLVVSPPELLNVPLTRTEVEAFHRANISKYSAPELIRARHILIEPHGQTPAADAAALSLATKLVARIRNGEDFTSLAKEFSSDIATKDKGGDLGVFGRGTMLNEFERSAFAMQAGEMVPEPVRTEFGYHIIQVIEHEPAVVQPLAWIYASVSTDAAVEKSTRMAKATADSIRRVVRHPAEARQIAERLGYAVVTNRHKIGDAISTTTVKPFFEELERVKAGQFLAESYRMKGQGYWVAWVDSITPPMKPTWDEAKQFAVDVYRRGAGERVLAAKRNELDSLLASGWTVDSLGALWGGLERTKELVPGKGLAGMSGSAVFDSVAFGTETSAPLADGAVSGWLQFPNGSSRVRMAGRTLPGSQQLVERQQNIRSATVELGLRGYFDGLSKRYPVKILEARMREMQLAAPSTEMAVP